MQPSPPQNEAAQRQAFALAVQLLGGLRPTARRLDCTERAIRYLLDGERPLHKGWLEDITTLLREHARLCTHVARGLDPLFMANLTAAQREERPDARRKGQRPLATSDGSDEAPLSPEEQERLMAQEALAYALRERA